MREFREGFRATVASRTVARFVRALARRWPVVLAGSLAAFALPGMHGHWIFMFVGLALFAWWRERSFGAAFADGWLFGFVYFSASLYWIVYVVHVYGKLPAGLALVPWGLLAAWCALSFGLASVAARWVQPRWSWWLWPAAVAAFEELRGVALTGFPWNPVGVALTAAPSVAAPAAWLGVTGLTFAVTFVAAQIADLAVPNKRRAAAIRLAAALLVWGASATVIAHTRQPSGRQFRFALVQGNIEQDQKWSQEARDTTLSIYEDLSHRALASGPVDLLVWPETAAPFFFQSPSPRRDRMLRMAKQFGVPFLFGAPAYERDPARDTPWLYNRAWLLAPDGSEFGHYDKVHLVPFGEYVPLQPILFFLDKIVEGIGSFRKGATRSPLSDGTFSYGVLICYEAIFPYETREFVALGADVLVQITNDAWFGDTAAPRQHLALAQMRAIENGIPLVRAANTGITGWVNAAGVLVEAAPLDRRLYRVGTVDTGTRTWFARWGWIWLRLWLVVAVALAAIATRQYRRSRIAGSDVHGTI